MAASGNRPEAPRHRRQRTVGSIDRLIGFRVFRIMGPGEGAEASDFGRRRRPRSSVWIERRFPKPQVACSTHAEGTSRTRKARNFRAFLVCCSLHGAVDAAGECAQDFLRYREVSADCGARAVWRTILKDSSHEAQTRFAGSSSRSARVRGRLHPMQ